MKKHARWHIVLACLALALATVSGCKTTPPGVGGVGLDPDEIPLQMGQRFEEGIRVSDVQVEPVRFGYNSFVIAGSELHKIETAADAMAERGELRLVLEGHCDERGTREYNMVLGEHRADAVRAHLIALGIDGDAIQTRSYGEEQPADPRHTEEAWTRNRRVAFSFYR